MITLPLCLLALSAVPQDAARVPRFERILWLHGGPAHDQRFFATLRELGFTAVSVSADENPAVPGQHALRFYRDQVVGKGVLELSDAAWRAACDAYERDRDPAALVRPRCLDDAATTAELQDKLQRNLASALPHDPWAVSLGDEISITRHANPLDFCFSAESLRAFRAFLAARYQDVQRLDLAWGTAFESFDRVRPFTADGIRARELSGSSLPRNLRPWAEHREFMDRQLAAVVTRLVTTVHGMAARLPCGLTGLQPPSAYGGHDYHLLMPQLSFWEAYDIGGARELAACLAPPGALQVATLFPSAEHEPTWLTKGRLCDMIAHGMAGAVVWSAGDVLTEDGAPSHYGRRIADAFAKTARLSAFCGAVVQRSPVWIVESQAAVRAHWMLDSSGDGASWIRRLSSYEEHHSTSLAARHGWLRLLQDLGLEPRFVAAEDLPRRLREAAPRLLVLPACIALSDEVARAIAAYVARGGMAVADHALAFYDEHLTLREKPALDEVFGVQGRSYLCKDLLVREGKPAACARLSQGAAAAEALVDGPLAEPEGAFHVHLENRFEKGKAVYLNMAVCEYGAVRLDPARIRTAFELRRRVRRLLHEAGAECEVQVRGEGLPTCIERVQLEARDGRHLLAIRLNALEDLGLMQQIAKAGPRTVQLLLPRRVRLRDLLTGEEQGPSESFTMTMDPIEGLFLEIHEES